MSSAKSGHTLGAYGYSHTRPFTPAARQSAPKAGSARRTLLSSRRSLHVGPWPGAATSIPDGAPPAVPAPAPEPIGHRGRPDDFRANPQPRRGREPLADHLVVVARTARAAAGQQY